MCVRVCGIWKDGAGSWQAYADDKKVRCIYHHKMEGKNIGRQREMAMEV